MTTVIYSQKQKKRKAIKIRVSNEFFKKILLHYFGETVANTRNRLQNKCFKSGDTETMYKLQNKSTILGFVFKGNFDCFAFES